MKKGQSKVILGSLLALLAFLFFFQSVLCAETGETSGERLETSPSLPEFSLKPVDTLEPVPVDNQAFGAPAPQITPQFLPPGFGGGASFGDAAFKSTLAAAFALNVADYFLTREALKYQGREGNPMMKGIVTNPYLFAAVKIGASAVSVFLLDTIYKKSKVLGWVLTTAVNSAMTCVVLHNAGAVQQLKARAGL